ncbi:MAG: glycoside hydrolase family 95-like protein, partial [Ferruginibacter sp.]
ARGGFEIVDMQWKDGKLMQLSISSNLGGNLRLRVPNEIKLLTGIGLKKAVGENANPFYHVEKTATPIISAKAEITKPDLKKTWLYDLQTVKGKVYKFILIGNAE